MHGVLFCSCKHFERMGIMCLHIATVLQKIPGYKEPSRHDCAIRWWCDYMYYKKCSEMSLENNMKSKSDDGLRNLFSLFNCLENNDIKGPNCDSELWTSVPIPSIIPKRFEGTPNDVTVLSYDLAQWNIMDLDLGPAGYLTQSSLNESFAIQTENTNDIQPLNSTINPYQQLQPLVQELYTAMDGTCNIGDIARIKKN